MYKYNYTVDWGDGTTIDSGLTENKKHSYDSSGNYEVKISGTFPKFDMENETRLLSFESMGINNTVVDGDRSWFKCTSLTSFDSSGLIGVKTCMFAWFGCTGLTTFNSTGLYPVKQR